MTRRILFRRVSAVGANIPRSHVYELEQFVGLTRNISPAANADRITIQKTSAAGADTIRFQKTSARAAVVFFRGALYMCERGRKATIALGAEG